MKHKVVGIKKINKIKHDGFVYNVEVSQCDNPYTNIYDNKLWVEQKSGVISHNCFPKDLNAMISLAEDAGFEPLVLKAVWEQNKKIRNNWDWANSPSAVTRKR